MIGNMFSSLLTRVIINHIRDTQNGQDLSLWRPLLSAIAIPLLYMFATYSG